jgi:hypothetical protein
MSKKEGGYFYTNWKNKSHISQLTLGVWMIKKDCINGQPTLLSYGTAFGDNCLCGELKDIALRGNHCKVILKTKEEGYLCAGFKPNIDNEKIPNLMKNVIALWI